MTSVVFLHVAAGPLVVNIGSSVWHVSNALVALASAAVPLFFMISGGLLLDSPKTLSISYTLKRRVWRVFVPFMVWSAIAIAYPLVIAWQTHGVIRWDAAARTLLNLPYNPARLHLWFMYALIPLYILSPALKVFVDAAGRKLVLYLLAIWVIFGSVLPTLTLFLPVKYRPLAMWGAPVPLNSLPAYVGYFVAGYYLMRVRRRVSTWILVAIIVADLVIIALGSWVAARHGPQYIGNLNIYTGTFTMILSFSVFMLAKQFFEAHPLPAVSRTVVGFLAPLTFGVYLSHVFAIDILQRIFNWSPARTVPMLFVSFLGVLALTVSCVWVASLWRPTAFLLTGLRRERRKKDDLRDAQC